MSHLLCLTHCLSGKGSSSRQEGKGKGKGKGRGRGGRGRGRGRSSQAPVEIEPPVVAPPYIVSEYEYERLAVNLLDECTIRCVSLCPVSLYLCVFLCLSPLSLCLLCSGFLTLALYLGLCLSLSFSRVRIL